MDDGWTSLDRFADAHANAALSAIFLVFARARGERKRVSERAGRLDAGFLSADTQAHRKWLCTAAAAARWDGDVDVLIRSV